MLLMKAVLALLLASSVALGDKSAPSSINDAQKLRLVRRALDALTQKTKSDDGARYASVAEKLYSVRVHIKEKVYSRLTQYHSGYEQGYMMLREMITGDDAPRRRLNALENWVQDLAPIGEELAKNEEPSFAAIFQQFQTATCMGGTIKSDLKDLIDQLIDEQLEPNLRNPFTGDQFTLELNGPVQSVMHCLCSSQWDFSSPEWVAVFNNGTPIVGAILTPSETTTTTEMIGPVPDADVVALINSIKTALPVVMGPKGVCNSDCSGMITTLIEFLFTAEKVAFGTELAPGAVAALPGAMTGCMCGSSIRYEELLDAVFPSNNVLGLVESVSTLLGAEEADDATSSDLVDIVDVARPLSDFLNFMFSKKMLCGGQCPAAIGYGTTLALEAGIFTAWPEAVLDVLPLASDADRPTQASIFLATQDQMGCMCSFNYAGFFQAAVPMILSPPDPSSNFTGFLNGVGTVVNTVFNGTVNSGGLCASSKCFNMVANYGKMATGMIVRALTTNFDGKFQPVTPGALTKVDLDSWLDNVVPCACHYFQPDSGGAVFSYVEEQFDFYSNQDLNDEDGFKAIVDTARGATRAAKFCGSNQCRALFNDFFAWVDKMSVGQSNPTPFVTHDGAKACNEANAAKCWADACWPSFFFDQGNQVSNDCQVCLAAPQGVSPYKNPFNILISNDEQEETGGHDIVRLAYWATCSLSTDCPAEGVQDYGVSAEFTLDMTMEAFDDPPMQMLLKGNYAKLVDPSGSAVRASDVKLTATSGSINVVASAPVLSTALKDEAVARLKQIQASTPAQMSTAMGVAVQSIAPIEPVKVETFAPAPPPNPPTQAFNTDPNVNPDENQQLPDQPSPGKKDKDGLSDTVIIAIAAGGGVVALLLVGGLLHCFCFSKRGGKGKQPAGLVGVTTTGGKSAAWGPNTASKMETNPL